jgi:hypothetical protein
VLFWGSEFKCTLKTPEKAKEFLLVSDMGKVKTRLLDIGYLVILLKC